MRKTSGFLSFFLLARCFNAFCQGDNSLSNSLAQKLQAFYSGHVIEKTYLHFDRPGYTAGDTIYFKAYVTFGEQHEPSKQSAVLYADLINPQSIISQSIKLELKNGLAWGDFALPDSLQRGNYRVRAYTKLMKNVPGTIFFEQAIPVLSAVAAPTINNGIPQNTVKPDLQFFPEGGRLLTGVQSKVAFKAVNSEGMGISVKGVVVDNTGKTVSRFESSHLGMGSMEFLPENGKTYQANAVFGDGSQASINFPAVAASGIVLAIDNSDNEKLTLGINCSPAFFDENKGKVYSLVMNSGVAVTRASIKLVNPLLAVDLKKNQFRTGIEQFTLFSPAGEPLSERLVFIRHNDMINLMVSSDKAVYKPGEKVILDINAKRLSDSIATGHFSVSVIADSKFSPADRNGNSILTWLLLSSDLKGYVEQPGYYFETVNNETQANLDVLMLTQGFRRFTWSDLLADKYPPVIFQPEKALAINGMLASQQGKPMPKEKVNLVCIDGGAMLSQVTDTAGKFFFTNLSFAGNTHFMLKTGSSKNKNTATLTYLPGRPEPIVTGYLPQGQLFSDSAAFSPQPNSMQLISLQKTQQVLEAAPMNKSDGTSSRTDLGPADQAVGRDQMKGGGRLSDHLNGLLNGVRFAGDLFSTDHKIPYLSAAQDLKGNPPMLVILDAVPLPLGSGVDDVDINDVERVEVYKNSSASAFGTMGGAGILYITTLSRNAQAASKEMAAGILPLTIQGYHIARTFYVPKYHHTADNNSRTPVTIYWNPEVVTGKTGDASVEFYNTGSADTYCVVIEGIDEKGNLGRQVYRYKVE